MDMTSQALVNSIGLIFDIVGVVLLFIYGIPEELSRSGAVHPWLDDPEWIGSAFRGFLGEAA